MQHNYDLAIRWTAFPLHPETPPEGRTLEALFAGRGLDVPMMVANLRTKARELKLPFGDRTMTYNSRRAQVLGKWAETHGRGDAFHRAVFQAYFADGRNIFEKVVLLDLAVAAGLKADLASAALEDDRYIAAVDADWQRSRRLGIRAVPTFHANGRFLTGARTYDVLERLIAASNG